MSRRVLVADRVGHDGVVTDEAAHQLSVHALSDGLDAYRPRGLVRQRRGWAYDGSVADVADNLVTVWRTPFVLSNVTRTLTGDDDGDLFIHNPAGAGTAIFAGTVPYLARCQYGDQTVFCAQDGTSPSQFYGGSDEDGTVTDDDGLWTSNEATITALSFSTNPDVGTYLRLDGSPITYRVLAVTSTSVTLEAVRADTGGGTAANNVVITNTGIGFPAVSVYEVGTFTAASPTTTGQGTKWNSDITIAVGQDAFLGILSTGQRQLQTITGVGSDTSLTVQSLSESTKSAYHIVRPVCGKDAASHKERFCTVGVKQHDDRVYFSPPGWKQGFPPGYTLPVTDKDLLSSADELDFLLDFIDVPSPNDGDFSVALLSSPNPLVYLKRKSAYGVHVGDSPSADLLPEGEGSGCIDIRSAWELPWGPTWASERGVLTYMGGRIVDLTANRINAEWRSYIEDFDFGTSDYCTIQEIAGVMVVHITTGGGQTRKTWNVYPFDETGKLRPAWYPVSNFRPRFMYASKVPGEKEKLLSVSDDDQGRVVDYAPAVNETGTARDADGTSPDLQLVLPSNLPRIAGASVEERLLEVVVEANIVDSAGAGSTMGGTVVSSERLDTDTTITTNLNSMASKTADSPKRYRHKVGVKAGLHKITLDKSATQTTESKTEISRIGFTTRAARRPI